MGQTPQQQKILILAAIPDGLRLDKEIREIQECIQRAARRNMFKVNIRTAVRPQDIRRAIAEEKPQIVHFCGHGLEDGSLLLEDEGGNSKPVLPEALASLFKLHVDYIKCVLFNACYSEKPAVAISQYIDYVIGMNNPIQDRAAIAFAQGFYDGLGYEESRYQDVFQKAFDEGLIAIQMEELSQGSIPVLKTKTPFATSSNTSIGQSTQQQKILILTPSQRRRLEQEWDDLQEPYDLLRQKLRMLRKARAVEINPAGQLQLEVQIEETQTELNKLESLIDEIVQQLG